MSTSAKTAVAGTAQPTTRSRSARAPAATMPSGTGPSLPVGTYCSSSPSAVGDHLAAHRTASPSGSDRSRFLTTSSMAGVASNVATESALANAGDTGGEFQGGVEGIGGWFHGAVD